MAELVDAKCGFVTLDRLVTDTQSNTHTGSNPVLTTSVVPLRKEARKNNQRFISYNTEDFSPSNGQVAELVRLSSGRHYIKIGRMSSLPKANAGSNPVLTTLEVWEIP